MTVGIAGLGLIGGSMAKAYKLARHTVLGFDIDSSALGFAEIAGFCDRVLDEKSLSSCDLILVALYPRDTIKYLEQIAPSVAKGAIVIDLCGTKKTVCDVGFALAERFGFTFVGGHPMAGTHLSGIKHARADLFCGAPMVLVPPVYDDIVFFEKLKTLLMPAGFGKFSVTTAEEHDRVIAFTSQLAHLVSNAYVKSPTATMHRGFSAGSYKDMTRVAWLNEVMWSELFLENREPLLFEIDSLISSLSEYRQAIEEKNSEKLVEILREGRLQKEKIDG